MKRKLSYKKMLATVGVLTVVLPMSLSIASCAIKEKQKNNDQKIVNAINQTNYSLDNIIINSTIDELKTNISSDFIKNSLDEINQKNFNNDLFSLNKIINEKNEEINNNDFKKIGLINAKINYNYGKIKNQFVDLKISVKYSDKQIVDAISETTYTVNITMKDSLESINKKINKSEFIKNEMKNNDIKNAFKFEDFKFNKITNNEEDLKQEDLDKWGIINAKIIFNYGEIKNKETLLIININASSEKIVDAINEIKYTKKVNFQSSVMELNDSINAEFIKNSLISEIKNSFKNNLFSLNKITNNKEIDLKDEDFTVSGSINAKINYNYDSFKNLTTNLTIIIGEGQISNKYELNDGKINKFLQISDSIIFAATENGNIWEIDFTNNTKINKYQLNEERINSLIKASNGKVYVGTITNTIWEIDLETETAEKKFIGFGDKYDSKTLIEGSKDKLYVGTGVGNVYELDINTGNTKKYRFDDWGDVNALVKVTENKIYAGTSEGKLWEIDLEPV